MSLLSFVSLFSAALALVMGVVVLLQNWRERLHRVFFLLCMTIAFVAFAEFGFRQAEGADGALFWFKASQVAPLIIPMIVYFSGVFTGSFPPAANIYIAVLLFVPALLFGGIDAVTGVLGGGMVRTPWGWSQTFARTPWNYGYTLWSTLMLAFAALITIRYFIVVTDRKKKAQARYVALAVSLIVFVTVVIDTGTNFLNVEFPESATFGYACANLLIAYAIRRHRLFVLDTVAASDTIVETMSDALFLVSSEGKITHVNKAARLLFNADSGIFAGNRLEDFVLFETPLLKKLATGALGIDTIMGDVPAVTAPALAGKRIPLSVAGKTMFDANGEVQGTVVTVRDISERVDAENALREYRDQLEVRVRERTEELHRVNDTLARERERLAITLRSIGDGVISCDLDCRVSFMNGAAERLTGWTSDDAFGRNVAEILLVHDRIDRSRVVDPVRTALQSGTITELTAPVVLRKRSGEERLIDDSAAPIRTIDGTINGVVVVFRDVTEKERLEEELFKAKRMESVAVLAGGIAHDFNNLLTGIGNQMFMTKVAARGNAEVIGIVNDAQRELLRAQKLAVQLLTFAQGGEPVMEVDSPKSLIEGSVGFFMSGSRSTYDLTFGDHLMNIRMDKGMMEQVLSNLVINAEQAMPEGGTLFITAENVVVNEAHVDPEKRAAVPLPAGVYVRISVGDTGPGIPDEIRDRVFDPFFSTRGKGRGLGLSIVQSVMKKHGGTVLIEPATGNGASFLLYLPAVELSAPDQVELPKAEFAAMEQSGGERILLMDDEPVIRRTTGKILELLGYRVVTADNGDEAVSHFEKAENEEDPFATVILDLTVPGAMGGRECIARLKKINPHVRAIVSSGYSTDAVMADHTFYGFRGVLRKPYTVESLGECLREVLG